MFRPDPGRGRGKTPRPLPGSKHVSPPDPAVTRLTARNTPATIRDPFGVVPSWAAIPRGLGSQILVDCQR